MSNLVNYIEYDELTGQILSWGRGIPPRPPRSWVPGQANQNYGNSRINLVNLQPEPKTQVTVTVSSVLVPADGHTELVISGIPANTNVYLQMPNNTRSALIADGTDLEITSEVTGVLRITFWHGLYLITAQEVQFV